MDCVLREWRLEDKCELADALNNPRILANLRDGLPYPYTEQDAADYITAMRAADRNKTFAFAITVENRVVGSIGVFRGENIHSQTAEMGYYIAEPYWGKGIGTSAVRQVCRYIWEAADILRIYAEPFAENTASCRVLEKAGFQLEGILRSNAVKNGEIRDMKLYALVRKPPLQIRTGTLADAAALAAVEARCFPLAEAATAGEIAARLAVYPSHFWLLEDEGRAVAFVDGMTTDSPDLTDEMYENAALHTENGAWQMIFGVNTLPEYRRKGCAARLLWRAVADAREQGRKGLVLTCKEALVPYYARFGFVNEGRSASVHGGVVWYQMRLTF